MNLCTVQSQPLLMKETRWVAGIAKGLHVKEEKLLTTSCNRQKF